MMEYVKTFYFVNLPHSRSEVIKLILFSQSRNLPVTGALAGERCFIWKELKSEYCELGCCGEGFERECCSMVWIIIVACIGGILLVACIIAVVCCCVKQKGKSGRVMGTNTTSVAYIGQQSKYYFIFYLRNEFHFSEV